jgi:hypothetical protein
MNASTRDTVIESEFCFVNNNYNVSSKSGLFHSVSTISFLKFKNDKKTYYTYANRFGISKKDTLLCKKRYDFSFKQLINEEE